MSTTQNESEHPEWRLTNTLTTPEDRGDSKTIESLKQSTPPLNNEQTIQAMQQLNKTAFVERFPEVERRFADPPVELQKIGLISFVPAKGATPNESGVFGFAKLRGNFATPVEANLHAEHLIRNVDSYHQIYHTYVGRPFPITVSSDYSQEVEKVDLQKEVSSTIREDVRKKREKEQQDIEEIKKREKELLADVKKEKEDDDDRYTTLRTKKAQLTWTLLETKKKVSEMINLIAKARKEIEDLEHENPSLTEVYYQKYLDARRQAGLQVDPATIGNTFMKYMVEDAVLPEVDEEYERLYGNCENCTSCDANKSEQ